jgi:hypothetical protein
MMHDVPCALYGADISSVIPGYAISATDRMFLKHSASL